VYCFFLYLLFVCMYLIVLSFLLGVHRGCGQSCHTMQDVLAAAHQLHQEVVVKVGVRREMLFARAVLGSF
jgi:hypothetical protein